MLRTGHCLLMLTIGSMSLLAANSHAQPEPATGTIATDEPAATGERMAEEARATELRAAREREEEARATELRAARERMEREARVIARLSSEATSPWAEMASRLGFESRVVLGIVVEDAPQGVGVRGVTPGGPAAAAGLRVGDVVIALDDQTLVDQGDGAVGHLLALMEDVEPGQRVVLTVRRNGDAQDREQRIQVQAQPGGMMAGRRGAGGPLAVAPFENLTTLLERAGERGGERAGGWLLSGGLLPGMQARWQDLEMVTLTPTLGRYFGTEQGLLVVRAPADNELGLRDGDVILDIGGRVPTSPEHAIRILATFAPGETLRVDIMREQSRQTLEFELPATAHR